MHRLTARLLLLFAFVGNLAPIALASSATPPHACCVRKAVHHCHDSETEQLAIGSRSCCNGGCYRALTSVRWARLRRGSTNAFAPDYHDPLARLHPEAPTTELGRFLPSRAPPKSSIA